MQDPQQAEERAEQQFTTATKVIMAVLWFFPGVLIGALIRFFALPTEFSGLSDLMLQYGPWMFGFGVLLAAFGWYFPNLSAWMLELIFGFDFNKD